MVAGDAAERRGGGVREAAGVNIGNGCRDHIKTSPGDEMAADVLG